MELLVQETCGSVAIIGSGSGIFLCTMDKDYINTGMGQRNPAGVGEQVGSEVAE